MHMLRFCSGNIVSGYINLSNTASEVIKAAKSMKNAKSCGDDEVYVELIIYGPIELHEQVVNILSTDPIIENILMNWPQAY